ncbi:MAG: HAD-IIIA family hydrolase, partial [Bacteroidota bacterium]
VKLLIFDVDGVLTDGRIIYTNSGDEIKAFNVKDGQIIRFLKEAGIKVGVITGRNSALVERRCIELKLDFFHQGVKDKWAVIESELGECSEEEVCYIGDDIIDLKAMINCGLGVAPSDGLEYVRDEANLVTIARGGEGVVREVADLILASQGKMDLVIK